MCHLTGTKTDSRRLENRKKEKDLKTERKKEKKQKKTDGGKKETSCYYKVNIVVNLLSRD